MKDKRRLQRRRSGFGLKSFDRASGYTVQYRISKQGHWWVVNIDDSNSLGIERATIIGAGRTVGKARRNFADAIKHL